MAALLIGPALDLVHGVLDKFWPDANTREKAKADITMAMMKGEFDIQLTSIQAVNQTMQSEAKSEHWLQWSWRPIIGLTFGSILVNDFILAPYLHAWITPLLPPDSVWTAMLVILGASATGRSLEKWQRNKGNGK